MRSALLRFILLFSVALSVAQHPESAPVRASASQPPPPKITTGVWNSLIATQSSDIIINVAGYPDLTPALALPTKEAKTRYVYETLTRYAAAAQASLRRELLLRHVPYQVLWVTNSIAVSAADRTLVAYLAARPDVSHIELDAKVHGIRASVTDHSAVPAWSGTAPDAPQTIPWGVSAVHAPQVWALGYTGQGIVLADLDTGVMWNHPALINKYRGWDGSTATHDYNWYDAVQQTTAPFDPYGHGTHTTGTLVGDDGLGNQIGVAPGARWIACRNMDSAGVGSVSRYIACFQFALAPTRTDGSAPDPSKAADITSNSWTCGTPPDDTLEQGCDVASALITATQALRDAGIMVIAAAGNSGANGCGTVREAPAMLDQALAIGAVDSSYNIATFSSLGPSMFTGHIKPDIVAPGVNVTSSTIDGSYQSWQGTSVATPHVAGVAALLWSAAPGLRGHVIETEGILRRTARPLSAASACGGVPGSNVPNNTYGYGFIDAQAAVSEALRGKLTVDPGLTMSPLSSLLTYTVVLTNYSALTRTNVVINLVIPPSTTLTGTISPPGVTAGGQITWTFPTVMPDSAISATFAVSPQVSGQITLSDYTASYMDGSAASLRGVPSTVFVYQSRYWLPFAMR